jgi:hypothetical protein
MTKMGYYVVSRTLWFCLGLVLTSQSGIAFTVQADQQHSLEAKTTLVRGGSSSGRTRISLNPTAATKEALAVSSGSVPDEGINEIKLVDVKAVSAQCRKFRWHMKRSDACECCLSRRTAGAH